MRIKTIRLEAPCASGTKYYEVDLDQVSSDGFKVNFRYGAIGAAMKGGTKTKDPVALTAADKVFNDLVKSKIEGESHYRPVGAEPPPQTWAEKHTGDPAFDLATRINGSASMNETPAGVTCLPPRLLNDADHPALIAALTKDAAWWVQIKHDGDRVQLNVTGGVVTMFSARSAKVRVCPKQIAQPFGPGTASHSSFSNLVLDGELVDEVLWVFDIFQADGVDLTDETYAWRHEFVTNLLTAIHHPSIRLVTAAKTEREKVALIQQAKDTHAEGVVFINSTAKYRAGRPNKGGDNLRWKFTASCSVIVAKHNVKMSVDVILADGTPIGTVTIGKGDRPPVGSIIEVEYLYCLRSLVQAVFKGIRTDIPREACTRSQLQFKNGVDPQ
jgi:bifunctional non-homologous end joining protein LigD